MNPIKIPKSFYLFGEKIQVTFSETYFGSENPMGLGFCSYRENKIYLRPSSESWPLSQDQIEQTFCHELMHMIIVHSQDTLKDHENLHDNEGFINISASLLHQALATMEYE
jgi:hypothetical protein